MHLRGQVYGVFLAYFPQLGLIFVCVCGFCSFLMKKPFVYLDDIAPPPRGLFMESDDITLLMCVLPFHRASP